MEPVAPDAGPGRPSPGATLLERIDSRSVRRWGAGYLRSLSREKPASGEPIHLYVCVADHFEPNWGRPDLAEERRRVAAWVKGYPRIAERHRDAEGRPHQRTFFFPIEGYHPEHLEALAGLAKSGFGDVEVHLHHENDSAEHLRETLLEFTDRIHAKHGLLRRESQGAPIEYVFIHGNWALDNSHPRGMYCGVDNELRVLAETGCRCDMTMPSAPSPTQSRIVNSIYYAQGRDGGRRAFDSGRPVRVGGEPWGNLMLIQGPLALHFRSRKLGLIPRMETGELAPDNPVPAHLRARLWVEFAPAVAGAPNHRFIKLHAHGCSRGGEAYFLSEGSAFEEVLQALERGYNDGERHVLHYLTAYEMYRRVRELERGAPVG